MNALPFLCPRGIFRRVAPRLGLVFLVLQGLLPAQDTPPSSAAALREMRVLAVGDLPPFRQEIRDGVRYELPPPPGSIPPRSFRLAGDTGSSGPVPLALGRISQAVKVPLGKGPLVLVGGDAGGEGQEPWLRLERPEKGDFLVLLCRHPQRPSWRDEPVALVLPDGTEGAPAGSLFVVNAYPQAITVRWNGRALPLARGAVERRELGADGGEAVLEILARDASGAERRYYAGSVTQNPGERGWVVIHRADGEGARRPLKVVMLREPARPRAPVPPQQP
jgi:hypothetical protein